MKKILLSIMLILLVVSVFAGLQGIPNPLNLVSETDVNGLDVVAISATVTPTFMQMSGRLKDVFTNNYVSEVVPVSFYCVKSDSSVVLMGTTNTDTDGFYYFGPESLVSEECNYGESFYVEVSYNQETYKSQNILLTSFSQSAGGNSGNGGDNNDGDNDTAEVPEFSTVTFGLAMLIAGLGFVLLRKN